MDEATKTKHWLKKGAVPTVDCVEIKPRDKTLNFACKKTGKHIIFIMCMLIACMKLCFTLESALHVLFIVYDCYICIFFRRLLVTIMPRLEKSRFLKNHFSNSTGNMKPLALVESEPAEDPPVEMQVMDDVHDTSFETMDGVLKQRFRRLQESHRKLKWWHNKLREEAKQLRTLFTSKEVGLF